MKPVLVLYASTHGHTGGSIHAGHHQRELVRWTRAHGRGGHPTDSSEDYDSTDWDAVWRFGGEIAALLPTPSAIS